MELDDLHRRFSLSFPTEAVTFISAPHGAGKTKQIVEMVKQWKRKVLVVTFNRANAVSMNEQLGASVQVGGGASAEARTFDSLCV